MAKGNKAHTATANRIAKRYGGTYNDGDGIDIDCGGFHVEVETTASLEEAIERLCDSARPVYVAMTNKEGVREAVRLTVDTQIGVMDPQGNIVRQCGK